MSQYVKLLESAIEKFNTDEFCVERKRFRRIPWTYVKIDKQSRSMATLLRDHGVVKGDTVAICAQNGPWWITIFVTCARLGIIIVPIDVNSSDEFVNKVLEKTSCKLLFKTVYRPLATTIKTLEIEQLSNHLPATSNFNEWPRVASHDTLEIVFTSGSTGDPKGVVLTHENVASNLASLKKAWKIQRNHTLLSMIPLSHMLEQTVGFGAPFISGSRVVYVQSVRPYQIVQALLSEDITTIVTVPAFLALLRKRIMDKAEKKHFAGYLGLQMKLAKHFPQAVRRYMFQGLYWQLGKSLKLIAIGGARLPLELENFWETLGMTIVQGYGLTETSPIATYSGQKSRKAGSVGRTLPGQQVKIADDGEIMLQGKNIFQGYFQNVEQSKQIIRNGWLHTGDIGKIDKDGYLFITGRKKNMLVTASGLNVYPEDIESELAAHPKITDSVVMLVPDKDKEVLTAVVLTELDDQDLASHKKAVNAKLASHQAIERIIKWEGSDFPRTPTRKIKRQPVIENILRIQKLQQDDTSSTDNSSKDASALVRLLSTVSDMPIKKITASSNLVNDLSLDSLARLELVSKIEEELGSFVAESDINTKTTVADLECLVQKSSESPKPKLFKLSQFETTWFCAVRSLLQVPVLWIARMFQKLIIVKRPKIFVHPAVYVANHTSHFDTLTMLRVLPLMLRRKLFVAAAADYFFDNRLKSFLLRLVLPLIPLDRTGNIQESLQRMGDYIDQGNSILIFPEGTRGAGKKLAPFKQGIGVIAQELEVPVVPIRMRGNETILGKGMKFPRRGVTKITIGSPMIFGKDAHYAQTTKNIQDEVEAL